MAKLNIPTKYPGKKLYADEVNNIVDRANEPGKQAIGFDPTKLKFDDEYIYEKYTQTGAITFDLDGAAEKKVGNGAFIHIVADGINAFNFSTSYNWVMVGVSDAEVLASGDYIFGFQYNGNNTIMVVVQAIDDIKDSTQDITKPQLSSAEVGNVNDTTIALVINESCDQTSTPPTTAFGVSGVASNPTIQSVAWQNATTIYVTLSAAVVDTDTPLISYTKPASGMIKDLAGNEADSWTDAAVTNNVTTSIIVMQDAFAGTVIDTAKWTITDPVDDVSISQNDELIFITTGNNTISWANNYLTTNLNFDTCFAVDGKVCTGGYQKHRGIGVYSPTGSTLILIRGFGQTNTDVYFRDSTGNVIISMESFAVGFEGKSWRIRIESGTIYFEYWNGTAWTELRNVSSGGNLDNNLVAHIRCGDDSVDSSGQVTFGNAFITNANYTTQYPQ